MKKKWIAVVPAIALVVSPLPYQTTNAASESENEEIQQLGSDSESAISPEFEALLNWPPEEQPIVKQGSHSFETEFIQVMLNHFGIETEVDGIFGSHTDQQVRQLQAENGLAQDEIVGVDTWTILLGKYKEEIFTKEKAIKFAEEVLDNDDLVFSIVGEIHKDSDGQVFYSSKAQSQDFIDNGGSGTVGFYDVYENGDVVESEPR
ncbi:hypothetical protein CWR48_08065 [Oceanobacillus arenosus]|uniref:Peptidoglycan binding-like domain-containing protein n=1 Tax=Oceanobacillus arenosus TaxID=1229153 RepID=A0A3D8PTX2_9BACI|nr:peptidoglycan-binding domain-containing protein [Oceanobacillus arenosus]RDW19444.1 hypothetical protein CWR48_08065 [Oceanobacillus arenosus]